MTAEDGSGFLVDVSCIFVNARPLFVLSFIHLSESPFWTVLCSFWGARSIANKQHSPVEKDFLGCHPKYPQQEEILMSVNLKFFPQESRSWFSLKLSADKSSPSRKVDLMGWEESREGLFVLSYRSSNWGCSSAQGSVSPGIIIWVQSHGELRLRG